MTESSISAGFARALMELAVQKGASRVLLAERTGIDPAELDDQDNRIPLAKFAALMRAGQELGNDPALALHFGETYAITELSIVALIGQACETVADAMVQLERFGRLIVDVAVGDPQGRRHVFSREHGQVWLIDTRSNPNEFPELTEASFARAASASLRAPNLPASLREIHFTHPAPSYRAEYDRIFQVPLTFGSDRNALLLSDDSFLTVKIQQPSRYVFGILSERAQALLKSLENAQSTRARVESVLMPILHTGETGMDVVASKMGLSRTTLSRKLKAEGVTFAEVLDELRHKMALNYLAGKNVSVTEAAYLVGFSEPAAFSRAFKRWTGTNPRAMRVTGGKWPGPR